jgi:hypothetical protein
MKGLSTMFSLRKSCGYSFVLTAAFLLMCGLAEATVIYSNTVSLAATDPTQLGRLSRNGIAQDWTGGETFPGVINPATSYHYRTFDLDLVGLEAGYNYGEFIQINFDSTASTTFLSAYQDAYLSASLATNWLGDPGRSGNFFGVNPLFFQVEVATPHHLILALNESTANGGLGFPGIVTVEAFSDTEFTDLSPSAAVPEPSTGLLLLCGMALLAARRRQRHGAEA